MTEREIFVAALRLDDADERAAYLDEGCRDDRKLRERVELLLRAHEQAGSFLDLPSDEMDATVQMPAISEGPGTIIGHFKLLQQIGEGGFGVVFMAEQHEPVVRKVALKIIKPGMDTMEVMARFEAEKQALALMDHPNIAKVLDAGATQTGRPYFVMELVRGIPITDYCDQDNLTPQERLKLFISVCQAVQHAHQKGIIHRDIKPTNVLVTLHDGQPVIKVIDFGVAKAINQRLTERTLFTKFAQMIGTPMYMSPEQAEMSGLDVDTRSDIYSLGVLLYELLTGSTPIDRERLGEAAYDEIRRIIREEEPPKPSMRISRLGETGTIVAQHRKTEPKKLSAFVRGDLDWIAMKALEKDRTRRYETAKDFAGDILRHLNDEPIEARPPSMTYRIRKFARRNKGPVAAALTVAVVLVAGTVGISVSLVKNRELVTKLEDKKKQLEDQNEVIQRQRNELLELLKDTVLAAAMGGQRQRTRQLLKRARRAEVSESWEQMVLGILCLYTGRADQIDDALTHLERAIRLDEENVAAHALLVRALQEAGRDWFKQAIELAKCQPKSAEDYLFLAFPRRIVDRTEGLEFINKGVELRRWPLAWAVKAELLAHYALDTGKWEYAAKALGDIKASRVLLPDNRFVLLVDLQVHHAAMQVASAESYNRLQQEADAIAVELEKYADYGHGHLVRARYFDELDRPAAADKAYRKASETGFVPGIIAYSAFLYGRGDREAVRSLLDRDSNIDKAYSVIMRAIVDAEDPGSRQEAIQLVHDQARTESDTEVTMVVLWYLYFFGDVDFVKDRLQSLESDRRWNEIAMPLDKASVELLLGRIGEAKFLGSFAESDSFGKSKDFLCIGHYLLGMKYTGEDNRKAAKKHFQACVDTRVFTNGIYHWARAFLRRMESPSQWPPWLPAEKGND